MSNVAPLKTGTVGLTGRSAQTDEVPTWVFVPLGMKAGRLPPHILQRLKSGDTDGALKLLGEALKKPGLGALDTAVLHNGVGVALNRQGKHEEAIAAFDRAGEQYPPATYNKAVSTLKAAIAESGQWEAFTKNKGSVSLELLDAKQVDRAVELLGKAVGKNKEFFAKMAREDSDWAPLLELPRFRELAALEPLKKTHAVAGSAGTPGTSGYADGPATAPVKREEEQKAYARAQKSLGFETS